jgi:hypothetical protein
MPVGGRMTSRVGGVWSKKSELPAIRACAETGLCVRVRYVFLGPNCAAAFDTQFLEDERESFVDTSLHEK